MEWISKALADLWAFIVTPTASIPAALSLAAIVVSVTVYVRSERATPRPRLETDSTVDFETVTLLDQHGDPFDFQPLTLEVTNRANGRAFDIRVEIVGHSDVPRRLGALGTDETKRVAFNWIAARDSGQFRMTWWEHPKNKMYSRLIPYGGDHSAFVIP